MQITRVSRELPSSSASSWPSSSMSSLWLGLQLKTATETETEAELATDLDSTVLGPLWRLVAWPNVRKFTFLAYTTAATKSQTKSQPSKQSLDILALILPATGVTIARESALDLGSKYGFQKKI